MSGASASLWPPTGATLEQVEAIPLEQRGLPQSTYELLIQAATVWPDRLATSVLPDAERWQEPSTQTFSELAETVHRYAGALHALGVRRTDAVCLVSTNCEELVAATLAAQAVGIAAPINPSLSAEHAGQLVRTAGARVVIAAGPDLDPAAWHLARELAVETDVVALLVLRPTGSDAAPALDPIAGVAVDYLSVRAARFTGEHLPAAPPNPTDIASFLHTGGTTGMPKLAARTHANEVVNAWMVASSNSLADEESVFAALPLFHTNALVVTVLAPLFRGQHVLWAGPLGYRDLPLYGIFWQLVERYRVAAMSAVPTVYAVLAHVPVDADITSLRFPIVGAAPLPPAVTEGFRATTGLELYEGYGLTEATCVTARNAPGTFRPGTVGQRLAYQEVRTVAIDDESGAWTALPEGEPGTIVVRGPVVFAGYVVNGSGGSELQADGIVRDGWLNTGDIGRVDADGFITLTGRAKDLIIRGGHNIDPAVIEDALLDHPDVTGAGAVGKPDAHAGEVPVAFITVAPGADLSAQDLCDWATARVPERAAAPKQVTVIDELPLTTVGKPFKPELRRLAAQAAAEEALGEMATATAQLEDGGIVLVVSGDEAHVRSALEPLRLAWRIVQQPAGAASA